MTIDQGLIDTALLGAYASLISLVYLVMKITPEISVLISGVISRWAKKCSIFAGLGRCFSWLEFDCHGILIYSAIGCLQTINYLLQNLFNRLSTASFFINSKTHTYATIDKTIATNPLSQIKYTTSLTNKQIITIGIQPIVD